MNLTCPCCGVDFPPEAMARDDARKQTVHYISRLPPVVQVLAWHYLGLHRVNGQLSWYQARKLAESLFIIIKNGRVQYGNKMPRPCTPAIWAESIQVMLDMQAKGTLKKINDHALLVSIAYNKADAADAQIEKEREERRRNPVRSNQTVDWRAEDARKKREHEQHQALLQRIQDLPDEQEKELQDQFIETIADNDFLLGRIKEKGFYRGLAATMFSSFVVSRLGWNVEEETNADTR